MEFVTWLMQISIWNNKLKSTTNALPIIRVKKIHIRPYLTGLRVSTIFALSRLKELSGQIGLLFITTKSIKFLQPHIILRL